VKPCRDCGVVPSPLPSRWKRYDYHCNDCHAAYRRPRAYKGGKASPAWWAEYRKAYYADPRNKARIAANMRRYARNPLLRPKMEARWILRRAVAAGLVAKTNCERCGAVKVEGHHTNYSKPLDVTWLCSRCHRREHAKAEGK
jgi:hypothetical protein